VKNGQDMGVIHADHGRDAWGKVLQRPAHGSSDNRLAPGAPASVVPPLRRARRDRLARAFATGRATGVVDVPGIYYSAW
jgi:hypothetical protein